MITSKDPNQFTTKRKDFNWETSPLIQFSRPLIRKFSLQEDLIPQIKQPHIKTGEVPKGSIQSQGNPNQSNLHLVLRTLNIMGTNKEGIKQTISHESQR